MKLGIQVGKHFIGYRSSSKGAGATIEKPFTENVEAGMPYIVSGTNIADIISHLRGEYTDKTLISLFGCIAEIFAPVDAIASRVVSAKFEFQKLTDGSPVTNNDYLNKLIDSVNPLQNFKQLLYEMVCYELVTGKSYLFKNVPDTLNREDYKNIATQMVLPSDRITIDTPRRFALFTATKIEELVLQYIVDKGTDNQTSFPPEKVLYRRSVSLKWEDKKIAPRSPLLSAEKAIANLIAVYEARQVVYIKRGVMGMWVGKKVDNSGTVALTPNEKKEAREELDQNYGLNKKKHTVGLASAPLDFIKTSMSIQELMPFEETAADAAAIYGVLGVPFELAPKPEGETYSNQMTAERGLYQNKVIPLTAGICNSLTTFWGIDKIAGVRLVAKFDHIEVLQENKKDEAERKVKVVEAATRQYKDGAITYNDWLKEMGYPSRGTEFDKYINELESVPMAVKIGVGGTQAMQSVVADPNLSEDAKANLLILLFGITEEQARAVVVTNNKPKPDAPAN